VQTQFLYWFGKVCCLRLVPKKPTWEFHYLTNPLHFLKHTRTTLPLCSDDLSWKRYMFIMKHSISYWITQVFGQGMLDDKRFLFERIMPFENWENSLENSCPSHLFIGLWWPFKNPMKRCDYWQIFWKVSIGNRLQCWCNRLHSYFSWTVVTLNLKFEFPTFRATGNRLLVLCNRLQGFSKYFWTL